jgi:hypothetical protein
MITVKLRSAEPLGVVIQTLERPRIHPRNTFVDEGRRIDTFVCSALPENAVVQAQREVLMRVIPALVAFAACAITIVVGITLFGSTVPPGACEGVVYDASICESARLRQSLLAAILIGSALIAASVTSGALIISTAMRGRPIAAEEPSTDGT